MEALNITELKLITIVGESGAGKTSVVGELLERQPDQYRLLLSHTTRSPRSNDLPGEYSHIDQATMDDWERQGSLLWPPIRVGQHSYASRRVDLLAATQDRSIYVAIVVPSVAARFCDKLPRRVLPIHVAANSRRIESRLRQRRDSAASVAERLRANQAWQREYRHHVLPYYTVTNDGGVTEAANAIQAIVDLHLSVRAS